MKNVRWIAAFVAVSILTSGLALAQTRSLIAFPEDYRNWARVKSVVILAGHTHFEAFGGFHHVYANDNALASLKEGKPFSKGAVLVFELFKAVTENYAITEGPRLVVGVMEKDPDLFVETAGWGFEDFKGENRDRAVTDPGKQCLSCHETRKDFDYVYSTYQK